MAQSLVIFDHSGSMNGARYETCRQTCLQFRNPFELWLFGVNVQKQGVVPSIPQFPCSSGTSISTMLNELYNYMSSNSNKYVYILTDGEDKYDEASFTNRFSQLGSRNHRVTVYDICQTNVEPLKRIFAKCHVQVATSVDEINSLVLRLQQIMANDADLIAGVTKISDNVQRLIQNYTELESSSQKLKSITEQLKNRSQTVLSSADQAVQSRQAQALTKAANDLKVHLNQMADHLKNLKNNERKAKRLGDDVAEVEDEIENLETKIQTEENSPNVDQQKISSYKAEIRTQQQKKAEIEAKVAELRKNSAAMVSDFAELQKKTEATQIKVTDTLKTI